MNIFTGSFFMEYPNAIKVSIARYTPKTFDGPYIIDLEPPKGLLQLYKSGKINAIEYTKNIRKKFLKNLIKMRLFNLQKLMEE